VTLADRSNPFSCFVSLDLLPLLPYIGGDFNSGGGEMLSGFKKFILRGNVVDMAVGVVVGAAFGSVVTELTKAFLTPLIALVVGKPDYSNLKFTVRSTTFPIGDFINACISFFLIAASVYFFVVVPVNWLVARMRREPAPADPTTKKCPECRSEIPIDARRCSHCTQPQLGTAA
jgi:large conductance mechanosensitive channel